MARVDEIPISSAATPSVVADILETGFCCSSSFDYISHSYPQIEKVLSTRRPTKERRTILTRKFTSEFGRRSVQDALQILSILFGNQDFLEQVPEFYREFPGYFDETFLVEKFKSIIRGRGTMQKIGNQCGIEGRDAVKPGVSKIPNHNARWAATSTSYINRAYSGYNRMIERET